MTKSVALAVEQLEARTVPTAAVPPTPNGTNGSEYSIDGTGNNPANPDPSREVRWGEQTHEEMLIGFVEFVVPAENAAAGPPPK